MKKNRSLFKTLNYLPVLLTFPGLLMLLNQYFLQIVFPSFFISVLFVFKFAI
jgi:hypothetical protein